jgi:carbon-monoxide dehydrogenase iron sulfur subunit
MVVPIAPGNSSATERETTMFMLKKGKCTNCRLCMLACTAAHYPGVQSTKLARIYIEDAWPEVGGIHVCLPCKERFCINTCPENALTWEDHVVLDPDKCTQCGECVDACPVGGVRLHPGTGYPHICDTCDGVFSCAKTCPTGAISRR